MYLNEKMFEKVMNKYQEPEMITYQKSVDWTNDYILRGGKKIYNNRNLQNEARKFFGSWMLPKNVTSFKRRVYSESEYRANFWADSLHGIGETHEEVFAFFREKMEEPGFFPFDDESMTLVDFWVMEFPVFLEQIGYKYPQSSYNLKMAFYGMMARLVDGCIDEVETFKRLKDFFKDRDDVKVYYAPDEMDFDDVDVIITLNNKIWHMISIKSDYAFSLSSIKEYRLKKGKTTPTCYINQNLERIFIRKNTNKIWHWELSEEKLKDFKLK